VLYAIAYVYAKAYNDAGWVATDICIRIGKRIRALRLKRHWTQEMLADHAVLGRVYLSEIENGRKEVCVRTLERIAKALSVPLSEFFEEL
jgi:transcriptional regulator with XRE-family HTH domain